MDDRRPFDAEDERYDAPDGAWLFLDGGRGWYARGGNQWHPTDPPTCVCGARAAADSDRCPECGQVVSRP